MEVEYESRTDYLLVTVTGSYDLDEAIERFSEAGGAPLRMAYVGNPSFIRSWLPGVEIARNHDLDACATTDFDEALEWLTG
jgi:hypothetical protein